MLRLLSVWLSSWLHCFSPSAPCPRSHFVRLQGPWAASTARPLSGGALVGALAMSLTTATQAAPTPQRAAAPTPQRAAPTPQRAAAPTPQRAAPTSRPQPIRVPSVLPAAVRTGYRRTETLLRHLNAGRYDQALRMMSPTIQKLLSADHLKRQNQRVLRAIGAYRPNTLKLHSRVSHRGQTRLIWHGRFAKEKGTILVLLNQAHQLSGFLIQSPSLLRSLRQEHRVPALATSLRQKLEAQLTTLLQGYNEKRWDRFCQPCSPVMKQLLAPPRFQELQAKLMKRYGRYLSRRIKEVRRLTALPNTLILRYNSRFAKQKRVQMQVIFKRTSQRYRIASWQLR